jgi:hypothetical protein
MPYVELNLLIRPFCIATLFGCLTLGLGALPSVWVPHPRDAFVFVARVGEHDAILLGRINNQRFPDAFT